MSPHIVIIYPFRLGRIQCAPGDEVEVCGTGFKYEEKTEPATESAQ